MRYSIPGRQLASAFWMSICTLAGACSSIGHRPHLLEPASAQLPCCQANSQGPVDCIPTAVVIYNEHQVPEERAAPNTLWLKAN